MGRLAVATLALLAAACVLVPGASASPYIRYCGTSQDGWLVGPFDANNETPWEVLGPWHINMSKGYAQSRALLRRFAVQEFGTHVPLSAVPCAVAQAIAISASEEWPSWGDGAGSVRVRLGTSGGEAQLGLYRCSSRALTSPKVAKVTCWSWVSGGDILGTFVIREDPHA